MSGMQLLQWPFKLKRPFFNLNDREAWVRFAASNGYGSSEQTSSADASLDEDLSDLEFRIALFTAF